MAFMNVNSKLSNEIVRESKLRQSIHCNGKLANANDTDPELRKSKDTEGKLTNCDYSLGWDRNTVRPVLEGNVKQRKPHECGLGFIFKSPSVPLLFRREWCPTIRARQGLFRNRVLAFSTRFHVFASPTYESFYVGFAPQKLN